ncbi:hypothetical protein ElyMa_003224200 [Elysia marginata]|uniref:Reelin domain-containing protein n=1 Tax=Elysia marginata TaxID=1093978 RepID=A0AAV4J4H0_9GAST|nr:hypothetical protein ElyMa_003224200 [Elysia marginata]
MPIQSVVSLCLVMVNILGLGGRVVSASDSRSGGFDSRIFHVEIASGKQFTLTFSSPPTFKKGIQLQAILEFVIYAPPTPKIWVKSCLQMYWSSGALVPLLFW